MGQMQSEMLSAYSAVAASTRAQEIALRPAGTTKAYGRKKIEFRRFCEAMYENEAEAARCLVTPVKAFLFVWYQAHRKKRMAGRSHSRRSRHSHRLHNDSDDEDDDDDDESHVPPFDKEEFWFLKATYGHQSNPDGDRTPPDPLGASQIRQYSAAVRDVLLDQQKQGINSLPWDEVNSPMFQSLTKTTGTRAARVRHRNAEEKIDQAVAPFLLATSIGKITLSFWNKALTGAAHNVFASLRDRFLFVSTLRAILRGESLFNADLSDMFMATFRQGNNDPHELQLWVLQLAFGKTNGGKKLNGRALRHKDPYECVLYALAMYLWFRFMKTGEMQYPPDFRNNREWFYIKLITPGTASIVKRHAGAIDVDRSCVSKVMGTSRYAESVKEVLNDHGLPIDKQAHLGRAVGPRLAEMHELPEVQIQNLGNWEPSQRQEVYSEKIPFQALRVMNGHPHEKGCVYIPRFTLDIPLPLWEEARRAIFPWAEIKIQEVRDAIAADQKPRPTALYFLKMLIDLRRIILQDTAEILTYSNRRTHPLFEEPIFASRHFGDYVARMRTHLAQAPADDPLNSAIEKALPGVRERIDQVQGSLNHVGQRVDNVAHEVGVVAEEMHSVNAVITRLVQAAERQERASETHERLASSLSVVLATFANDSRRPVSTLPPLPPVAAQQVGAPVSVVETGETGTDAMGTSEALAASAAAGTAAPWLPRTPGHRAKLSDFHASFSALFDEYRGSGVSTAPGKEYNYEGKPVPGGFRALEATGSTAWRRSYTNKERAHFLRVKNVVDSVFAVGEGAEHPILAIGERVAVYDNLYAEAEQKCHSPTTDKKIEWMVKILRRDGFLEEPKKRNRASRANQGQARVMAL